MKKSGKIALVIGGSGGIGSAIASRLILDGFKVYSTYYKNSPIKKLKNPSFLLSSFFTTYFSKYLLRFFLDISSNRREL